MSLLSPLLYLQDVFLRDPFYRLGRVLNASDVLPTREARSSPRLITSRSAGAGP